MKTTTRILSWILFCVLALIVITFGNVSTADAVDNSVTAAVDPDLEPGFPVQSLHTSGRGYGGPALHTLIGNIDSHPDLEIVATGLALGPLYAWKSDGSLVPGWPIGAIDGANYVVMGNLSKTSGPLDVVSTQLNGTVTVRTGSGAILPGWPQPGGAIIMSSADLNDDGLDEVIFADRNFLHVRQADGSPLPGWPISVGLAEAIRAVAVADLDGDGSQELVFVYGVYGYYEYLHAYHSNGTPVIGFPVPLDHSSYFSVIGDVDGDGLPEIVIPGFARTGVENIVTISIFSNQGILKREMTGLGALTVGPPALADLDYDGIPEILVQTNSALHVWRGDGTVSPGWPVALNATYDEASPVVGDVDGDGLPDIVAASRGQLYVFNRFGVSHPRFPKRFQWNNPETVTPAIADIDGDGRNEIIAISDFWDGHEGVFDKVWVYDLGGPPHGPVLWGQLLGGPKHQGSYRGFEPRSLVVNKIGTGDGTVSSNLPGISCGVVCSMNYVPGTVLSLVAVPDVASIFSGWTGACSGTGACNVAMDGNKSVTAIFVHPLSLNFSARSQGELGVAYNLAVAPSGGLPPYKVSVVKGSLPPGLSLGSPEIVGTPTRSGTYNFTIQVSDQLGGSVSQKVQIKVLKTLAISTKALKTARVNRTYSARLAASGGQGPYSWSLVSGTVPDGLSFDPSSGSITGTPTAAATVDLTFQVSDALGGTIQKTLALTVK